MPQIIAKWSALGHGLRRRIDDMMRLQELQIAGRPGVTLVPLESGSGFLACGQLLLPSTLGT